MGMLPVCATTITRQKLILAWIESNNDTGMNMTTPTLYCLPLFSLFACREKSLTLSSPGPSRGKESQTGS